MYKIIIIKSFLFIFCTRHNIERGLQIFEWNDLKKFHSVEWNNIIYLFFIYSKNNSVFERIHFTHFIGRNEKIYKLPDACPRDDLGVDSKLSPFRGRISQQPASEKWCIRYSK